MNQPNPGFMRKTKRGEERPILHAFTVNVVIPISGMKMVVLYILLALSLQGYRWLHKCKAVENLLIFHYQVKAFCSEELMEMNKRKLKTFHYLHNWMDNLFMHCLTFENSRTFLLESWRHIWLKVEGVKSRILWVDWKGWKSSVLSIQFCINNK